MAAAGPQLHLLPTISAHIFYFKLLSDYLCALQLPNHNKRAASEQSHIMADEGKPATVTVKQEIRGITSLFHVRPAG